MPEGASGHWRAAEPQGPPRAQRWALSLGSQATTGPWRWVLGVWAGPSPWASGSCKGLVTATVLPTDAQQGSGLPQGHRDWPLTRASQGEQNSNDGPARPPRPSHHHQPEGPQGPQFQAPCLKRGQESSGVCSTGPSWHLLAWGGVAQGERAGGQAAPGQASSVRAPPQPGQSRKASWRRCSLEESIPGGEKTEARAELAVVGGPGTELAVSGGVQAEAGHRTVGTGARAPHPHLYPSAWLAHGC